MRFAFRILGVSAFSLAFVGFLGCQEDNERGVMNDSAGKTGVDPKAPANHYESLKVKTGAPAPAATTSDPAKSVTSGSGPAAPAPK